MIELDDVKVRAIYGGSAVEEGSDQADGPDQSDGGEGGTDGADAPGRIPTTGRGKPCEAQRCEVGMWEMF